jgi:hypothetical protein
MAITLVATTTTTMTAALAWSPLAPTSHRGLPIQPTTTTRLGVVTESVAEDGLSTTTDGNTILNKPSTPPFKRIMAANRAEISVRIQRAATELNAGTVGMVYFREFLDIFPSAGGT